MVVAPVQVFGAVSVSVPPPIFVRAATPETGGLRMMSPEPPMLVFVARATAERLAVAAVPVPLPKETAGVLV